MYLSRIGRAVGCGLALHRTTNRDGEEANDAFDLGCDVGDVRTERGSGRLRPDADAGNGNRAPNLLRHSYAATRGWRVGLQYAGKRAAGEAESAMIRERIRAIASGGLPDNTGGANAYRASWYNGPWAQKHAQDGRVVGGNRYAYEPGVPNGPYAPYANPKEVVTPRVSVDARPIIVPPPAAAVRSVPNMTPGGFDVNRINPAEMMRYDPTASILNSTTSNRSLTQTNSFNVKITGSQTPQEHAKAFTRAADDLHALTLSNIQSATV